MLEGVIFMSFKSAHSNGDILGIVKKIDVFSIVHAGKLSRIESGQMIYSNSTYMPKYSHQAMLQSFENTGTSQVNMVVPLQARVASGEDIFGPLLRKYFLNNNHRVTVEMLPDSKLGNEKEQAEKDKLKSYQADLASNDIEATIAKTKELKERQVRPYPLHLREHCDVPSPCQKQDCLANCFCLSTHVL